MEGLLEDVEEDEVDGLPFNFSYGSSMDSDNDALPEAFYNFLQSRGFSSLAAFGTWMHLKILETKTTAYLACYLRISKPTLYKYMRLVDPNWRGVYYRVPPEEVLHHVRTNNAMNQGGTNWGIINSRSSCRTRGYRFSRRQIREALATHDPSRLEQRHMTRIRRRIYRNEEAYALCHMDSYCKLHIEHLWRELFERVVWFYKHLFESIEDIGILDVSNPWHNQSLRCVFAPYLKKDISHWVATWNLHEVRPYRCGDYFRLSHVPANLFQPMEHKLGIMPAVGGKDIEDLLGPFLSNVEGATLSEAFLMHREGLNLDEQYLLHLDLTMECAMADVAGVDLPLYIESALPTATPARSKNAARFNSSRHYGNTSRARSQALDVPQSVQPTVPRDTCQPLDFPSSVARTSTPTASHPQLPTAFEQAEHRLTLHTLQHMRNLQHVSFSSPSLESSSPSIQNEQVRTPHAHGVVQSGTLPPTPTPTRGRAHGIPYSATATSPATPPTATTLATPSTGTSASTWPSTSRSNKRSSSPGTAQHAILLSLQASGIQPSSMTNPGAFVRRARQSNGGEAHAESAKFGLSSIRPCYWPPQTSWGAIANKANGNRATVIYLYNVMEHLTDKHWLSYQKQARALEKKDVREQEDSADEEDILPLPEETLPTQNNMDISGVEEQGDGGDEPHQGSPKTSLSLEIVAPGHAADRPMVVYDSDGGGLEDHGVPPPPFLEGSSSTPFTLMELLDNFSTVEWIDATNAFNEAVQLTTQDSANFIMLQIEEVSALQDATTTLDVRAQGDAEVLLQVQWLKHKLLGCFAVESTSDEEMLDAIAKHPEFHWAGGEIFLRHVLFNQAMPHWQDWESLFLKLGLSEAQYEDVFCDNTIQQLLAEVSINVPPSILESTIAWFIEKRDLRRNWAAAQQLRELFDTVEILYCKFSRFCIEKAMLRPYRLARTRLRPSRILIAPNNEFSCFQFAFNTNLRTPNYKVVYTSEIGGALVWEESTINVGGPHAKAIREAVCQILGSTRGLFVLREGATYWHPRMPVHSRTLRQEKRDVAIFVGWLLFQAFECNAQVSRGCTIATLAIAAGKVPNEDGRLARGGLYEMDLKACASHIWNALNQLLTELGEGYEQAVEACVAAVVWHYLFIEPNVVGDLLQDGFQHSMRMEARQRPYKSPALLGGLSLIGTDALLQVFRVRTIIPPAEFINCLIFDQDFGENFRSWIVDIIQDMSPKELSKFHHFAVDSPEFRPGEPIWIQVERQSTSSTRFPRFSTCTREVFFPLTYLSKEWTKHKIHWALQNPESLYGLG
ncbi:hypothetical protein SELMODRAFT_424697 [Selaginella moellendorffii]|uniref:Integrase core domain-containing protein n=1 Tax=Selaginella moellendorffii TaxID=88036 RepID=D8SQS2_SELML|nr:hypothetical protein SELMODRAFT_424697 [Selaginella moellendorffii]